jgi:hypothetical protein
VGSPTRAASIYHTHQHHRRQCAHLDGVPQGGAVAVHLQARHVRRARARARQRLAQQRLLRGAVGRGEGARPAVGVHRGARQQAQRGRLRGGVGQRAEEHRAAGLAAHVAVGRGVQRLGAPLGAEHLRPGQHQRRLRHQAEQHAGRHRAFHGAVAEGGAGQVGGHQRGGARGVHGHGGPAEAKGVGQPAGGHAGAGSGEAIGGDAHAAAVAQRLVVGGRDAHERAHVAARQGAGARARAGARGGFQRGV